ncbi:MAG: glycosyltransferase family 4 protein, partial [Nitrospira sp.]|nr:glycosyltransferase family 4 protein [Nitrospira sp.]
NPERIGGAERQQWLLARALVKAGWAVTVGVREGLQFQERQEIEGVRFVGIGAGQFLWSCYRFLLSERPDWWYWRAADHLWGPAVEIAKIAGVRTIFAAAFDTDVEPRRASFRRKKWWPLFAWGLYRTDRIFVQHHGQFDRLTPLLQKKASVIPSFAGELQSGSPHADRKGYIAWVGTLRRPKRADLLIEIAKRLPEMPFIVCGGISTFQVTEEYGRQIVGALMELPNVTYLGKVKPGKTGKIIAEANLFLSTADGEGFPNTFLEAWGSGTPVISLTIDPDKVIQRKGIGVVTNDLEQLVREIRGLMSSPALRDEIGARAKQHVYSFHSELAVMEIFKSVIENISTVSRS